MRKPLVTLVLSASLASMSLVPTAQPAQANEELIGQLLFGAIAAGIAYELLRDDDGRPSRTVAPAPRSNAARVPDRRQSLVTPQWTTREKRRACRQTLPTQRGDVRFIADRCLNHPRAKPRVPQNCLRDRWVDGDWRQVYNRRCLARYGEVR